jgi:GIY-YIG catalytic domain
MSKYLQGKIYKLTSIHTNEIYVGSTCYKYLSQRLKIHKYDYINKPEHNVSCYKLFKLGDVKIELIENYPCNSSQELCMREQYWLETLSNCVNMHNAYTSIEYKKANAKTKINCICGSFVRKSDIAKHNKTTKHQVHILLEDFTQNKIYK